MFKNLTNILYLSLIVILLNSCISRKELIYFQHQDGNIENTENKFVLTFKRNDELRIDVSSSDIEAVKPFNLAIVAYSAATGSAGGQPMQQTYIIDNNGEINFPYIGKLKLEGKTWSEAINLLTDNLKPYVKDVTVNINIMNFRVNVLGDVRNPGSFLIPSGRVNIIDALSLAGDLNISGIRNIEIKRQTGTGIKSGNLDLKSNDLFKSEFFFLQQNDIVYVAPNNPKSKSASFNKNAGILISTASIFISLLAILIR